MVSIGGKLLECMANSKLTQRTWLLPPDDYMSDFRKKHGCPPDEEEVLYLHDRSFWGSKTKGIVATEAGIYNNSTFYSYDELFSMFIEYNFLILGILYIGDGERKLQLFDGKAWEAFFNFFTGSPDDDDEEEDDLAAPPKTIVCEYCGKKFEASLESCPGCGAPAQ